MKLKKTLLIRRAKANELKEEPKKLDRPREMANHSTHWCELGKGSLSGVFNLSDGYVAAWEIQLLGEKL